MSNRPTSSYAHQLPPHRAVIDANEANAYIDSLLAENQGLREEIGEAWVLIANAGEVLEAPHARIWNAKSKEWAQRNSTCATFRTSALREELKAKGE